MSLSRAFTTKRSKSNDLTESSTKRTMTLKHSGTIRYKISAPVELISTTNMLSYNAPDLYPSNTSSRSSNSGDDLDNSPTAASTPMTSPDTSSVESSPTSLEPNHLSCYFGSPSRQSNSNEDAPSIPTRSPSHTKRNAEILARKRSLSRMSSPKNSISTARSSISMFSAKPETFDQHPFGQELAKVSEIAEDYGISKETLAIVDEEEQKLLSLGLFKFCADDYRREIQGLFVGVFDEPQPLRTTLWI